MIQRRLREKGLVSSELKDGHEMYLKDGRLVRFADEPDVAIYQEKEVSAAIEIKGGIDPASVLERIGAALKSLQRIREENPRSTTILVLHEVSLTQIAAAELNLHRHTITDCFTIEDVLNNDMKREKVYRLLHI